MSGGSLEDDQGLIESAAAADDERPWKKLAAALGVAVVMFVPTGCEMNFEDEEEEVDAEVEVEVDEG